MFNTNAFLDGDFYSLGFSWARASADDKQDVLYKVGTVLIRCWEDT